MSFFITVDLPEPEGPQRTRGPDPGIVSLLLKMWCFRIRIMGCSVCLESLNKGKLQLVVIAVPPRFPDKAVGQVYNSRFLFQHELAAPNAVYGTGETEIVDCRLHWHVHYGRTTIGSHPLYIKRNEYTATALHIRIIRVHYFPKWESTLTRPDNIHESAYSRHIPEIFQSGGARTHLTANSDKGRCE